MADQRRYCVFRIVNAARKEIFLVATPQSIFDAMIDIERHRPAAIREWDISDISKVESLEFNVDREAALVFVKARVERGTRQGFRYILDIRD